MLKFSEDKLKYDLTKFLPMFQERRDADLIKINACLQENNLSEIKRIVHSWKGFSAPYGYPKLVDSALIIEAAVKDNDSEKIAAEMDVVVEYLEQKKNEFKN